MDLGGNLNHSAMREVVEMVLKREAQIQKELPC